MAANVGRYIRWTMKGSTANGSGHFVELQAWTTADGNLALGKTATQSWGGTTLALGDGDTGANSFVSDNTAAYNASVVVDLTKVATINSVVLWTFWGSARTYHGVTVETSLTNGNDWQLLAGPFEVATNGFTPTVGFLIYPNCFAAGTEIDTRDGPRAVETLRRGDSVRALRTRRDGDGRVTLLGAHDVPVRNVVRTAWDTRDAAHLRPVRVPKGVLGATRDVRLSERHGVLVGDEMVAVANVSGTVRDDAAALVEYHHVQLEDPTDLLRAHGVVCESLR